MSCFTKTIGRILFITIIASSAYLHLSKPQNFTTDLSSNYAQFAKILNDHVTPGLVPPAEVINWKMWSKILGLFEGFIAILILFGDCWGGFFLFVNLLVCGCFDYQDIISFVQWDGNRQVEFARYVFFVGASVALMACNKKSSQSSCKEACSGQNKGQSK